MAAGLTGAGPDDVPWVQHGARQSPPTSFAEKQSFYGRFLRPVLTEGPADGVLCDRHRHGRPVHPDRAAVQQVAIGRGQGVEDLPSGRDSETNEVYHGLRMHISQPFAENAGFVLGVTVRLYRGDLSPGRVLEIGATVAPADGYHLVAGGDQPRY